MFLLILTFLIRIVVGMLFILAGWSKLRAGESFFLRTVLAYELLSSILASVVARVLPLLEVMIGSMLVLGLFIQPLAYCGLALLLIISIAVVIALIQKKTISCGCFGLKEKVTPIRWTIVIRNLALMLMLSTVAVQNKNFFAFDSLLKNYLGNTGSWYVSLAVTGVLALSSYLYTQYLTASSVQSETSV